MKTVLFAIFLSFLGHNALCAQSVDELRTAIRKGVQQSKTATTLPQVAVSPLLKVLAPKVYGQLDSMENARLGGIDKALNELLSLYATRYTTESTEYADALMWCARTCAEAGDNKQGKRLMNQSLKLFRKYGNGPFDGRDTINEIFYLDLKATLNYQAGRDYKAGRLRQRTCELKRLYFGEQSEIYLNALLDLSQLYAERLCYRRSEKYHNKGYDSYIEMIKREFCNSSESERTAYWDKAVKYINKTLELGHKAGRKGHRGGQASLASAAYDAALLSKGLLLNTTIGFEDYISNSGNYEAVRHLQLKKTLADQQVSQHVLDSLDYVILRALQAKGQQFQLPHLSIGWKDVAEKLSPNDLSIEFYRTSTGDYGALLLKKGWKSPKVVRLGELVAIKEKYEPLSMAVHSVSLENYTPDQARALWNLSRAIWTDDIVRYFPEDGQGRIFFAADGDLLITGIEYLPFVKPNEDGSFVCLSDLFNVYRLSSTRELVQNSVKNSNSEMAVFGGLRYDMNVDDMIADARQHHIDSPIDLAYVPNGQQRDVRAADRGIPYLVGTQREADTIMAVVAQSKAKSLMATPFMGYKGTETSFKAFSGKRERVIHIATHGFFYNEEDSTFNRFDLGENALVRSGLFFAGADNKWLGDDVPHGVDDGFLTSLEISNLDFRGLDLVVLSACETGKGNVKGDGVFGLQRGFKMASAQSILMSLWKVDDDATCLLMTEFYKNWIGEGKTKHEALESAKQAVRTHKERGWDNPKYWAAFILLDGLD